MPDSPKSPRRFPPPWTFEEYRGLAYIVRDANRFAVECLLRVGGFNRSSQHYSAEALWHAAGTILPLSANIL
jgi:hypothetical protein